MCFARLFAFTWGTCNCSHLRIGPTTFEVHLHASLPCLDCSVNAHEGSIISLLNEPSQPQPSAPKANAASASNPSKPSKGDLLAKYSSAPKASVSGPTMHTYTDRSRARREIHGFDKTPHPASTSKPKREVPTDVPAAGPSAAAPSLAPEEPVRYAVARTTMTPRAGLGSQALVTSEEFAAAQHEPEREGGTTDWRAEGLERARKRFRKDCGWLLAVFFFKRKNALLTLSGSG